MRWTGDSRTAGGEDGYGISTITLEVVGFGTNEGGFAETVFFRGAPAFVVYLRRDRQAGSSSWRYRQCPEFVRVSLIPASHVLGFRLETSMTPDVLQRDPNTCSERFERDGSP